MRRIYYCTIEVSDRNRAFFIFWRSDLVVGTVNRYISFNPGCLLLRKEDAGLGMFRDAQLILLSILCRLHRLNSRRLCFIELWFKVRTFFEDTSAFESEISMNFPAYGFSTSMYASVYEGLITTSAALVVSDFVSGIVRMDDYWSIIGKNGSALIT